MYCKCIFNFLDSKVIDSSEQIREIIEVFESRDEIESVGYSSIVSGEDTLCLSKYEYNSIVFAVVFLIVLLCIVTLAAGYCYRYAMPWHLFAISERINYT